MLHAHRLGTVARICTLFMNPWRLQPRFRLGVAIYIRLASAFRVNLYGPITPPVRFNPPLLYTTLAYTHSNPCQSIKINRTSVPDCPGLELAISSLTTSRGMGTNGGAIVAAHRVRVEAP